MKIFCNNCKHLFEVDAEDAGRTQYIKTESVFRVELFLKSPCPVCGTKLKVVANDKKQLIGYPLSSKATMAKNASSKNHVSARKPSSKKSARPAQRQPVESTVVIDRKVSPRYESTIAINRPKKMERPETSLETRVKLKLQKRLDGQQSFSVNGFRKNQKAQKHRSKEKVFIPNLSGIAKQAAQPKFYLSLLTILTLGIVFGIMRTIFHTEAPATATMAQVQPSMEEGLEEYEPTTHEDAIGGPAFPSETDRKTGLEDETIKKINSNLQILHLPPLKQVTSTYGIRLDPFTKKLAFHAGIDFKADLGTKIEAAMDGVVKYAGPRNMYGNAVILKHENGYETLYGHLSKTLVKQGQKIKQKDIIALAGSTGRSTGPHLHFELIKNGKKIDPLSTELLNAKK